jgi:hypothetical protein
MDAEVATLTSTAATTMVKLLITDGWERLKTALGMLWRRAHPDQAATIEADISSARAELLTAYQAGDTQAEQALIREWQARLYRVVVNDPSLQEELRRLVTELSSLLPNVAQATGPDIEMRADASGHGRVYQAGRDLHIGS